MPVDPSKKTAVEIQEIPVGRQGDGLVDLINDRIRAINALVKSYLQNPALGAADLGQFQIKNLADPKDDLDGVNLRTLKRAIGNPQEQQVSGTGDGIEQPTIYLTFDGLPFDGEESPFAPIMEARAGFTPVAVVASAVGAPTARDCEINLLIAGVDMLKSNLVIPVGSQGPVFASNFALPGSLAKGTLIQGVIAIAGGATQVTIGLSIRGH